jgi:recombination associated protein RdgC
MSFKNAIVYSLTGELPPDELFTALLQNQTFIPVRPQQFSSSGWVPLGGGIDDLHFVSNGSIFLRLRTDSKVIKNSAITREVEDRAKEIQRNEGRKVGRREKQELKEAVINENLPTAMVESKYTIGFIDYLKSRIVIDAGTVKLADDFLSKLRDSLGSLKVRPLAVELSPTWVMTNALNPDDSVESILLDKFTIGDKCSMVDMEGGKARFSDLDLTDEYVTNHITKSMMSVDSLALSNPDRMSFILTDSMVLKKLVFLGGFQQDVLDKEPEDDDLDSGLSYLRTTTFLLVDELRELIGKVIDSHGGEAENFDPMDGL